MITEVLCKAPFCPHVVPFFRSTAVSEFSRIYSLSLLKSNDMSAIEEDDVPDAFVCGITYQLFVDPVILGDTGHTFERTAIEQWLLTRNTNPLTGLQLSSRSLASNVNLRAAIEAFIETQSGRVIQPHELQVFEQVATGSEKTVFRGQYRQHPVAVLKLSQNLQLKNREARMFARLGYHPHLVRFHGRTCLNENDEPVTAESNALVTEYAPLGNLAEYLGNLNAAGQQLSTEHLLHIAEQVADGMIALHAQSVIHRDLAARNVMVFEIEPANMQKVLVKVGDYGLSTIMNVQGYTRSSGSSVVPIRYMPPESISRRRWSAQSDIWSFGVLLWEIFSYGMYPYGHVGADTEVAAGVVDGSLVLSKPPGNEQQRCPDEVWTLALQCMRHDITTRPLMRDIKATLQTIRFSLGKRATSKRSSSKKVVRVPNPQHVDNIIIPTKSVSVVAKRNSVTIDQSISQTGEGSAQISEADRRAVMQLAVDQNSADAQFLLAVGHATGEDIFVKDQTESFKWLEMAANQGHIEAQLHLAGYYSNEGEDKKTAIIWYRKAADQGNSNAQNNLGVFYANGDGVLQDHAEAVKWFSMAAEQGNSFAQFSLAIHYDLGLGVTKDKEVAGKWYYLAAMQGLSDAQHNLGIHYIDKPGDVFEDEEAGVKWFMMAARQGHSASQYNLGVCYRNGRGITKDETEAVRWYRAAADQGYTEAQDALGSCYEYGRGVPKNEEEAVRWYLLAAGESNASAQNSLGKCYMHGVGVIKNEEEAVKWLSLAADKGDLDAVNILGKCFLKGQGVPKDEAEGVRLLSRAAYEHNHADSMLSLAYCYVHGIGVGKDEKEAVRLYHLANNNGSGKK